MISSIRKQNETLKNNSNEFWESWLGWNRFRRLTKMIHSRLFLGSLKLWRIIYWHFYCVVFDVGEVLCARVFFSKLDLVARLLAWYLLLYLVPLAKSSNNNLIRKETKKNIYEKCLLHFCKYYSTNSIVYITTIKSLFASMLCKSPHTILVDV